MKATIRPQFGHVLDLDALELSADALTLLHNMNTRKRFPSRIGGRRIAYPVSGGGLPSDPFGLLNFNLNTFNWWLVFGREDIWAIESGNDYDISIVSQVAVTDPREWSWTLLNGIPVFTNGKNGLAFWTGNGVDVAAVVPDWPAGTVCKAVAAFRYHIFALNIDGPSGTFDNMVMWSNAAEPGALPDTWTPAADNEAGSLILADTPGRVICGVPLGAQLMVYKPESIFAIEYVGGQNKYEQRGIVRSVGALGPHTVIEFGQQHLVLGNDDVMLVDGISAKSIAEERVKLAIANSIDETNAANAFIVRDLNRRETRICIPEAGSQFATIAHIWDERRDAWHTEDLNNARTGARGFVLDTVIDDTWDSDSEVWDDDFSVWNAGSTGAIARIVTGEENVMYVEGTTDTIEVTVELEKTDLTFNDPNQYKVTSRVRLYGSGDGLADTEVRLGARDGTDDSVSWGPWRSAFPNGANDGVDYETAGRLISLAVRATTTAPFTIDRIEVEAEYNGSY